MVNVNLSGSVPGLGAYESDEELAGVVLFENYPDSLRIFAAVCCIIYMAIGIPGNLITIIALARCSKVQNATAIFIMNLSLSDFLFCCFNLPQAASTFWMGSWSHGKFLCRMFPLTRYGLVAVSVFTVLTITINRYVMISHPILYPKVYKKRYIIMMIASIWAGSFGSLLPTFFEVWGRFSLHPVTGSCTIVPDEDGGNPKQTIFIIAFALPSFAIIVCYARILCIVRKTAKTSRPKMQTRSIEPTIYEIPTTVIPSTPEEVIQRRDKTQLLMPCFYSPEFSSCNDSSARGDSDSKCAPEFKATSLSSERAHRIRQSFMTTFRRSTAMIKPRLPTKKDKRLLTMIIAIVSSFLVCHLPITLTKTISSDISNPSANIASYLLIYIATCINPIIYVVMSVEYRQAYKNLFKCR